MLSISLKAILVSNKDEFACQFLVLAHYLKRLFFLEILCYNMQIVRKLPLQQSVPNCFLQYRIVKLAVLCWQFVEHNVCVFINVHPGFHPSSPKYITVYGLRETYINLPTR